MARRLTEIVRMTDELNRSYDDALGVLEQQRLPLLEDTAA